MRDLVSFGVSVKSITVMSHIAGGRESFSFVKKLIAQTNQKNPDLYNKLRNNEDEDALKILLDTLSADRGSGIGPRFNFKVNNLVFYAQGGGSDKKNPRSKEFLDESTNWGLFKPTFVDGITEVDYHLKIS